MYLELEKEFVEQLKEKNVLPEKVLEDLNGRYRYSDVININYNLFTLEEIKKVYDVAKEMKKRSCMMQISAYVNLIESPKTAKVSNIKAFAAALEVFIKENLIRGWIFKTTDDYLLPYLVTGITYTAPEPRNERPASVQLSYMANSKEGKELNKTSTTFYSEDVVGKTVEQALNAYGIFKETQEYIDEYDSYISKYAEHRGRFNVQYLFTGKAEVQGENRWDREMAEFVNCKCINDEELLRRKIWTKTKVNLFEGELDIPVNPFIYMFNLEIHKNMYVHISKLTEYVYDDTLKDKLILPEEHRDLIDVLVQHMDILMDDIIKGKSGGTTILCCGAPGLGKTLSAEVYSEIIHKPLYKVNSGQLGTTPDEVEKHLETILKRAQRWGAVMLLDEADTYIRKRDDDIRHNAIVAAFLRTLEYFSGLLFMTTNRENDVDDAIVSRCIATIKYQLPKPEDAAKIWKVLSTQFGEDFTEEFCKQCVDAFPNISGRDIKELLKLSIRFAKAKNEELSVDIIRKCAQFRGV